MPKYIDREKFRNILEAKAEMAIGTPKEFFYNAVKMLDLIPTADVVEVVRCEDCKFLQYGECRVLGIKAGGDFYCYLGERKEE